MMQDGTEWKFFFHLQGCDYRLFSVQQDGTYYSYPKVLESRSEFYVFSFLKNISICFISSNIPS